MQMQDARLAELCEFLQLSRDQDPRKGKQKLIPFSCFHFLQHFYRVSCLGALPVPRPVHFVYSIIAYNKATSHSYTYTCSWGLLRDLWLITAYQPLIHG